MKKKEKNIPLDVMYEIIEQEISQYDIKKGGCLEKKMTLVKLKKRLDKYAKDNF